MKVSLCGTLVFGTLWFALMLAPGSRADVDAYRWVDADGVVHFGDAPPASPRDRSRMETLRFKDVPYSPPEESGHGDIWQMPPERPRPKRSRNRFQEPKVELYSAQWCGYCRRARAYLESRGVPFTEYDIERDEGAARRRRELAPGSGVPLAVINGVVIVGFNQERYEKALERP